MPQESKLFKKFEKEWLKKKVDKKLAKEFAKIDEQEQLKYETKIKCCLCGKKFEGLGNNPAPLKKKGKCCDDCNLNKVVSKRLGLLA